MGYYAGLDIGGTNGRLKIMNMDGRILGEFQAPGFSINTDGYEKSRQRCRELVLPVLEKLSLRAEECLGICAAVSGVDSSVLEMQCRAVFEEMGFAKERVRVLNDCEIFLLLSEGPALVVVSGTGSICFGRDDTGKVYRTGGWNHIVSDEGSGFHMGLLALQAAGDYMDGRADCPVLTELVMQKDGLDTLEKLNDFINDNLFEKSKIARYSETAYQAALEKDEAAVRIHEQCAGRLYGLIKDTYKKMKLNGEREADLWLWGSVLVKNGIIRQQLSQMIRKNLPELRIRIPEVTALDTALRASVRNRN